MNPPLLKPTPTLVYSFIFIVKSIHLQRNSHKLLGSSRLIKIKWKNGKKKHCINWCNLYR